MRDTIQSDERIGESEQHGDTNTDQERSINQTGQQEHFGLQCVHQFRLTCRSFEVLAAHHSDTDAGTDSTQTDNESASESNESDVGHDNSLVSVSKNQS